MVFGYLNRNYEEALHIPVGPDNLFEPGPPIEVSPPISTPGGNRLCSG